MQQTKNPYRQHLFVCTNQREGGAACCARGGGVALRDALKRYVTEHGLSGAVQVSQSGCQGLCEQGPNVMVFPEGFWYHHVREEDLPTIIQAHLDSVAGDGSGVKGGPVRAILFDLGNVLVPFDHLRAARGLAPHTTRSPQELYQWFFDSPLQADYEEGRVTSEEFFARLAHTFRLEVTFEQFAAIWNGIFWEDPAMTALVRTLAARYRLVGVSNTNPLHFAFTRSRFAAVREIPTWIVSHEVGMRKPDRRIYERAIAASGVPPAEILYVEDRLDLVEAGRGLGLRGEPFINAQRLAAQLAAAGVTLEDGARGPGPFSQGGMVQ